MLIELLSAFNDWCIFNKCSDNGIDKLQCLNMDISTSQMLSSYNLYIKHSNYFKIVAECLQPCEKFKTA